VRRSLAIQSFLISSLIILIFVTPLALFVRSSSRDRAIADAKSDARALTPILSLAGDPRVTGAISSIGRRARPRQLSVVFPDGSVLGADEVIDQDRLANPSALARARKGESLVVSSTPLRGEVLYEPVLRSNASLAIIRVFVPTSELRRNVAQRWLILAVLGVFLVGLAVFVSDRIGRTLVSSVGGLAETANRLGRGDVTARNEPTGPPEVQEVGRSLNALADRIDELLGTERAAAADLQHRLRTPVTALRAEISAMRHEPSVRKLDAGLDELTRTIDEIIREAAQPTRRGIGVRSEFCRTVRDRVAFWAVLAEDQRRVMTVSIPDSEASVAVVSSDVGAVVDALIDNVFSHTPDGTEFSVEVSRSAAEVTLRVRDFGPGFSGSSQGGIIRGASGTGSTGLGLDIVRKTVEGAGGRIEKRSGPGAVVEVTLPCTE
jgi:signal transduction histidine kinase